MIDFPQKLDAKIGPTSPFPYLKKALRFVIGSEKPDWFTRIYGWYTLVVGHYLIFWYALGTITFFLLDFIEEQKGVFTRSFIEEKALFYKMSTLNFEQVLFTYHAISGFLWILSLVVLIFVYRQKKWGIGVMLVLSILLNAFQMFYISWAYYRTEMTWTDKFLNVSLLFLTLFVLLRKKSSLSKIEVALEESIHADQNHPE